MRYQTALRSHFIAGTLAPAVHAMELTPATSAPALSHAFRRKAVHSEIGPKLLTDRGANFHVFSEQALILQGNLSDFDSAMRRFESSRPSHVNILIEFNYLTVPFCSPNSFGNAFRGPF